ncbi:hypothetical protein [Sporosarcina sp. P33]|uniref:hypothetical protein n=1 Tax=Sporosarcina sp. P33 TaxID=1930764 RepID=UPI0009C0379C|nr:hypothetical protein [Sporosarcina sp. P33]ARD48865.1 hypothetical protein SporoP33_11930 [Sporosarcina sp. P33]
MISIKNNKSLYVYGLIYFLVPFLAAAIAAYYYTIKTLYNKFLNILNSGSMFTLLFLAVCFYIAQFLSGFFYNWTTRSPKKDVFKHVYDCLCIVTYAIYEFAAFLAIYFLVFMCIMQTTALNDIPQLPGAQVFSLIGKSFIITYLIYVISSVAFHRFFRAFREKVCIDKSSLAGEFIKTFQASLTHLLSALILVTTFLGILDKPLHPDEHVFFIGLTLILLGGYCFTFYKSDLHLFIIKGFLKEGDNE